MNGRHRDKVRANVEQALAPLFDGARIMVGGFGLCGNAEALIAGVVTRGVRDLHLISNNAGNLGKGLAAWLKAGIVGEVTCTYVGNNDDLHAAMGSGRVKVNIVPQGTFVERMRAAGAGIPAFFTPTGVGTVVAEGKETRRFRARGAERTYVLETALEADFALLRCKRADSFGNARFWRTARNFSPIMATAAETTIVETDELVPLGTFDPDDVHLPGIFVHHVV
ncbi:MAG: CoA transferase subunit A, partial [Sandaracinaceae bacterium]|nr:CoA transferase subunit A [Sandaracinaceae bacterium]